MKYPKWLPVLAGAIVLIVATAFLTYVATVDDSGERRAKQQTAQAIIIAQKTVSKLQQCAVTSQAATDAAKDAMNLAGRYKKQADRAEEWMLVMDPPRQAAGE